MLTGSQKAWRYLPDFVLALGKGFRRTKNKKDNRRLLFAFWNFGTPG